MEDPTKSATPSAAEASTTQAAVSVAAPPPPPPAASQNQILLFAALPSQVRQADLSMLGNLHRRAGDTGSARGAWARVIYSDLDIQQGGGVGPSSQGHVSGLQAGSDLMATDTWHAGVYVGSLDGSVDVSGNPRGAFGRAGSNDLRSGYLGAYGTWTDPTGWYADVVLQAGDHRYDVRSNADLPTSGKGRSYSTSLETGKAFALTDGWSVEPQAQLMYLSTRFDDVRTFSARVRQDADGGWIGRLGVRIKGDLFTAAGRLQPYARVNLYRAASGTDVVTFTSPVNASRASTETGYTSTEVAGGFSLALSAATMMYGEVGRLFSSGGDARVKSSVQGSLGLRVSW
ncbi:autotransporter outer membrane beta-barrel domain-containing protein [Variovorax ureilyticus]|uniref:Autotransporter outer membrane beta-barrel domain-containing protein n=1 Tax=Variovorax ureilyticus TaxID=1836198 RepID=A0ABU8VLM8_9BURK